MISNSDHHNVVSKHPSCEVFSAFNRIVPQCQLTNTALLLQSSVISNSIKFNKGISYILISGKIR